MYYRIKNGVLFDYSDYQYSGECQYTDIITKSELDKDKNKVIVEEYEVIIPQEEGEEIKETRYRLILNPDYPEIELNKTKQAKIFENDKARDEALNQGVVYEGILFDSDTDQKVNLLAIVSTMGDTDKIVWFGKDNQPLECNKEDLINIGGLITQLHSFCWTKNAEIKEAINRATTIEEVENIEIDYTEK